MVRRLYYFPGSCALAVHIALEWVGEPYEAENVPHEGLNAPDYLALNPAGVVPTLVSDGVPQTEVAAILLQLVDEESGARLGPPVGAPDRAALYRWLIYLSATVHPHFWPWFSPQRYAPQDAGRVVRAKAEARVVGDFDILSRRLDESDWLVGEERSVADALFVPIALWATKFTRPTGDWPRLAQHLDRLRADKGVARAMAAQGLA